MLGRAKGIYHRFRSRPGQVVREHWRKLPQALYIPVQKELEQMLARGIIQESQRPWRSPLVMVPKPNGAIQLCVNFRKVNTISSFDAFPMPNIEEMLEKIW